MVLHKELLIVRHHHDSHVRVSEQGEVYGIKIVPILIRIRTLPLFYS